MDEFLTACPRNCYSTCTFRVQVENGRLRRILPYAGNLATPEGPCIKGLSYIERAHSPLRIIHPLLKSPDGSFKQIPADEALNIIASRIDEMKRKYGSHSIMWYKGSGNAGLVNEIGHTFWKYFGGVTTTYGNLCWPAGLEAVRVTLGSVKHNVPWDMVNAHAIIIWGKNPAETNIQEMSFIGSARSKGAKIIVVDPRRTATADRADHLFCPRPGTDAALALAIASVIVDENLFDIDFISSYVSGFDEFKKNSLIDPAEAEKICGIPAEKIKWLARTISTSKPVTFLPGYGLQRYTNGGQTIRAILSLALITGNIGKSGAGFNFANLRSYIFDEQKEPLSYYPDKVRDAPFRRTVSMAKLGRDMLLQKDPEIKAIWVERGNPLLQSPDTNTVARAFMRSEFTVVMEQFMTDTAKKADVILPAKDIFEQSDIIGSYWSPYVQFKPKILEPEGEVIPESEVYFHLAEKLKIEIPAGLLPAPGNENTEAWLERRIAGYSGLTLEGLKNGPVISPGLREIAYDDFIFDTPSGKIELCSDTFSGRWGVSPYPFYVPLNKETDADAYPLVMVSPNRGSRIHSQFGNLEVIRENSDCPAMELSAEDACERGITTGDRIKIFNRQGSVETIAHVTGRVPPGMVVFHNGIWTDEGGGSNYLTIPAETDIGHGAAFHGISVQVEKS